MKKGDVVTINDDSWSRQIKNNKLVHGPGGDQYKRNYGGNYVRKQYIVIETGCSFPNTGAPRTFNNTVIQAIDSGKVVFIEERFLELVPPTHQIIIDGRTVELSDKSYKNLAEYFIDRWLNDPQTRRQ